MANVLEIILSGDTKQFDASLAKSEKRLKEFGEKMQNIGRTMSTYVTAPLALAGGMAVKFASDFNESLNKVDVAFGESSASVRMFAKTALDSFGIAEGTALDMSALFGDMATSMGISTKEASNLSTSMVGLAGDLASFKNMNIEEVTTALSGVFTGETESLKRLGIVMTEINLKQFAQEKGIRKTFNTMTQAEKVMLRYEYVMSKTANAQGDFARTGGGFANQFRMMTEGLKQLGAEFGQVMLPVLTKFIKFINEQVKKLKDLGDGYKGIIVVLGLVAGAIGPIIYAVGLLSSNFTAGIKIMKDAYIGFVALLNANPYILLASAFAGLTLALKAYTSEMNVEAKIKKQINDLNKDAEKSIAGEISTAKELISIAKNTNVEYSRREKALKQLQDIHPKYYKGLTLEKIATEETTKALEKHTAEALLNAKTYVLRSKYSDLLIKQQELEIEGLDSVKNSYVTYFNAIARVLAGENPAVAFAKANTKAFISQRDELEKTRKALKDYADELDINLFPTDAKSEQGGGVGMPDTKALTKYNKDLQQQLKAIEIQGQRDLIKIKEQAILDKKDMADVELLQEEQTNQRIADLYRNSMVDLKGLYDKGLINKEAYDSRLIDLTNSLNDSLVKSEDNRIARLKYYSDWDEKQQEKTVKNLANNYKNQIALEKILFEQKKGIIERTIQNEIDKDAKLTELNGQTLRNQQQFLQDYINALTTAFGTGITPEQTQLIKELKLQLQELGVEFENTTNKIKENTPQQQMVLDGLSQTFSQVGESIVKSFGEAKTAFGEFTRGFASFLINYMAQAIAKVKIDQMVASSEIIKKIVSFFGKLGPAGWVAMAGAIAGGVALIKNQFGKIQKFADGGIVSGPTMAMVGEYSGAKRNPEVIAPLDRLQSMIGGAGGNVNVTGEFVVRGQDLVLALQRADQFKNRIS